MIRIVCNSFLLRKFRTIDVFQLDLGTNLKGPVNMDPRKAGQDNGKLKIKDEFIVKYNNLYNRYASKSGHIGPITFYEDVSMPMNQLQVFKDENIYETEFTSEDDAMEPRQYLSNLLESLDEEEIPGGTEVRKNVIYTNMPEDVVMPDMALPRDQYIQAIMDMKKKEDDAYYGSIAGKK